ncbi:hypothetical protein E3N88_11131 [Mikania micrantha]|uniref:Retrotransposon gag domain-containing protein n=1 Tax=Mikania micrantha TaxID=192012 RepID=A0A5N6PCI7_9ASTR|nr:hypothetical protein E3N88_11131 [Mikania micrantha]
MPHLRSHGPPPELSLPSRSDSRDFSEGSTSEVSASTPIFADFSEHTSSSSTHSSPRFHFVPPMAARRTVHQQATAGFTGLNNPITMPNITNENSWQIPSYIMTAINNSQFNGRDDEDAPAHLARLTRICGTFKLQGATNDAIFLQRFPFSLSGRAATWLDSHPPGTFTTWASLRDAFLKKYFPPAKAARLRDEIHSFRMAPDEPYYLAWERFQNLLSRCSQHGLSEWALVEKFYNGLTYETRARFDTSAGGHLMGKRDVADCNDLFESFAQAEYEQRSSNRNSTPITSSSSSMRGVHHVNTDTSVAAALESLARDVKDLKMRVDRCEICRGGHATSEYLGQGQPSGSSGSSLSGNGGLGRIEELLTQLVAKDATTQKILHEHDVLLKNQQSAFLDLQRTAVTTRFGGGRGEVFIPPVLVEVEESERLVPPVDLDEEEPVDEEIEMETPGRVPPRLVPASTAPNSESPVEKPAVGKPVMFRPTTEIDLTRVPYPARLTNQKHAKEYGHFLDMFRQLKINLPFIEALQRIPKYVKFLKELLKGKDRLGEVANVPLSAGCSAVILNKLPEKLADPGMFTIPCLFGDDVRRYALADSGASINLMPYSLYEKLALGDLSPTRMTLSLVDRSVKCPRGILKNVLVKVDKFMFPMDFVVMDMEADTKVPIILGRPFLRTAKAIIDAYEGKLTFRVGDESVCLKIAKSMRADGELVHQVDGVNLVSDEVSVAEVMGEGPWDVSDRGHEVIVREEILFGSSHLSGGL